MGVGSEGHSTKSTVASALQDELVDINIDEQGLSITRSGLGDNPIPAVQSCTTIKSALDKLYLRHDGKSMVNKLSILHTLLNTKPKQIKEMEHHVALLESKFSGLIAMEIIVEESMRVAILLVSLSSFTGLAPFIASISTVSEF